MLAKNLQNGLYLWDNDPHAEPISVWRGETEYTLISSRGGGSLSDIHPAVICGLNKTSPLLCSLADPNITSRRVIRNGLRHVWPIIIITHPILVWSLFTFVDKRFWALDPFHEVTGFSGPILQCYVTIVKHLGLNTQRMQNATKEY